MVHVDHGIARYAGMTQREYGGDVKEYLQLDFAGDDKIFLPADQIGRITPILGRRRRRPSASSAAPTGSAPSDACGGRSPSSRSELLEIYAAREAAPGFSLRAGHPWQRELEEAFPYTETPDQLRTIEEVKGDMLRRRPMDRLVCGDVGYGKTEVALRAAFKAVQDGKQVAVLVPTTVLAQQHFTPSSAGSPPSRSRSRCCRRFVAASSRRRSWTGVADGRVDILIGTHRILSKDIAFADLGLLVVDEEQRFGVATRSGSSRCAARSTC